MRDGGDPGPPDGWWDDEDGSDLTNEEFRNLVKRASFADDEEATRRLIIYFRSKLEKKVRKFPGSEQEEVRSRLLDVAFNAAKQLNLKPIEKPRNYVMRAVSLRFLSEVAKSKRRQEHEGPDLRTEDQRSDPSRPDGITITFQDTVIRGLLGQMLREETHPTRRKAAEVVALTYLLEISEKDACELLDFGDREAQAVRRMIRRWRQDSNSPLNKLLRRYREENH